MNYLEKLQKIKVGDTVWVKSKDGYNHKQKIISIENNIVTIDCFGNDENEYWKFSLKDSNAITPPTAYWISTEKKNNP